MMFLVIKTIYITDVSIQMFEILGKFKIQNLDIIIINIVIINNDDIHCITFHCVCVSLSLSVCVCVSVCVSVWNRKGDMGIGWVLNMFINYESKCSKNDHIQSVRSNIKIYINTV